MKENASRLVSSAILGYDGAMVYVNDKRYFIPPPTIHRLAGAGYHLSSMSDGSTIHDMLLSLGDAGCLAKALSWFIAGGESLAPELSHASVEEIVSALESAYSLISVKSFIRLSTLARSVASLTAKQKS